MMATKVRRLPLVVSGVQGRICFTDYVADWVRNRRTVSAASCPDVSLDEDLRAKEGGKEKTGETSLQFCPSHGPLRYVSCHSRFVLASVRKLGAWRGDSCKYMSRGTKAFLAMGPFHCRLASWLAGQLFDVLSFDWLSDWLIDLPVDLVTDELIDWLTGWPINCLGVTVGRIGCSTPDWRTDWLNDY